MLGFIGQPPASGTYGKIPIRNLWYMLLYAWDKVEFRDRWPNEVEQAPTLDALFARILCRLVEQRLRIGLGRDYVANDGMLRKIRGRIDLTRSLRANSFERGAAYCHFQEFSVDAPKNQLVRSTLLRLRQVGAFGPPSKSADDLRVSLGTLVRVLGDVSLTEVSVGALHHQNLGRNDTDYRLMLFICELLLLHQMPISGESDAPAQVQRWSELILHNVYERFVANFYKHHFRHWSVRDQQPTGWHAKPTSAFLPSMKLDIVLLNPASARIAVIDTKFTAASLVENQFGSPMLDSSHLYQMYAYLRTQEDRSPAHRSACGILLYPKAEHEVHERIEVQGHQIWFESVDLSARWETIHARLIDLAVEAAGPV